jgi:serralysin
VIVGAEYADGTGASYVVFGHAGGFSDIDLSTPLTGANGFKISGVAADDRSGHSVKSAGDVNNDGFADLIVGARDADPHGSSSGASYVVFGRLPDTAVNRTGTDAAQTLAGGNFNDKLSGLGGNDALWGHGGKDTLTGGLGKDSFEFNALRDSLKGSHRDKITDFNHHQGDKIDLSGIDANNHRHGNQAFHFIAHHGFTHHAGELRLSGHVLQGDVNGDGKADFEIHVNVSSLHTGDFVL